jgi:hypothetical protein
LTDTKTNDQSKAPDKAATETTNPADATGLQTGVGQILVDHELEQGTTVKIKQPKRRRADRQRLGKWGPI